MKKYGYIRVSSKDQNPDRQWIAMREAKIEEQNIYLDKESGKDFTRPSYCELVGKIQPGDLLVIKSIDRLGRNYEEIKEQWAYLTRERGADIQVLDMPLLDTTTARNDLTGILISDLVLQLLAYVAETERAFIRQRQAEGIAAAKEKGVRFGRIRLATPDCFDKYFEQWCNKEISVRKAAKAANMSPTTFYRRCQERLKTEHSSDTDRSRG